MVGEWNMRLDTPNGVVEPKLTITKGDKDTLNGTYVSVFGEREPKNLRSRTTSSRGRFPRTTTMSSTSRSSTKARRAATQIEGTNEFEFGDNTGTMKFTGKRTPPEEKKPEARPAESKPTAEETAESKATTEPTTSRTSTNPK